MAAGEIWWRGPGGWLARDLQRCVHCQFAWLVDPSGPERGFCRRCMGPVCGRAGCTCLHYEAELAMIEQAARRGHPAPLRCVHCGAFWTPAPGSGRERGWCVLHNGPLCGATRCRTHRQSDARRQFGRVIDEVAKIGKE